ncbi:MAG TPA: ribosomal protein S18-alanine N-acetyltransferase [Actinomycetota bacterium]|jgi:[ribosomal protein S18]-alanine N-acetyltransferase|nr:ribosomal protein S18-alanine N-acetyltransferase [Actinomycetota bacterium]
MAVARKPEDQAVPPIEIARMRRRHLRRVLAIEGRVYPRPWSASLFLSELSQRATRSYVVARIGGFVVGYCGMMFTGLEAHVTNIAVDPDYHHLKIGSRLLLKQITEAIARGAETISLEVRVSNDGARAMYEKFGFSVTGVRKGYYIETNEDAYVMVVEDASSTAYRLRLQGLRDEVQRLERGRGG